MFKSPFMRVMLFAICALILVGVTLLVWLGNNKKEPDAIEILLTDVTQSLPFKSLKLLPGDECGYTIRLKEGNVSQYDLELDFAEIGDKTLKNFARVKILSNDEVLYDELLADAFADETMIIRVNFAKKQNTELKIVYYLPVDIGNEAKNAEADFELRLTASNE